MKKRIRICTLVLLFFAGLTARGQEIKKDPIYLKQLNFLWGITSAFATVRSECNSRPSEISAMKAKQAKVISALLKRSEMGFAKLKATYPTDKEIVEVENFRLVLANALISLQDPNAKGPPMWQLHYVLVQMSLEDRLAE